MIHHGPNGTHARGRRCSLALTTGIQDNDEVSPEPEPPTVGTACPRGCPPHRLSPRGQLRPENQTTEMNRFNRIEPRAEREDECCRMPEPKLKELREGIAKWRHRSHILTSSFRDADNNVVDWGKLIGQPICRFPLNASLYVLVESYLNTSLGAYSRDR